MECFSPKDFGCPWIRILPIVAIFVAMATAASAQGDAEAKVTSAPSVTIPDGVFAAGVGGKLVFAVSLDNAGNVTNVRPLAGPSWPCGSDPKDEVQQVTKIVRDALAAATFSPRMKNGRPVEADLRLTYPIRRAGEPDLRLPSVAPKRINRGIIQGVARSLPKPSYPPEARANRASGEVGIEIQVDLEGRVTSAGAVSGHPDLQRAARDAACLARFSPTILNKEPVEVTGVMLYNFMP